jgi:16S rRNA C967 or C1407 C5-methylase (RsmB/RsmF family)
MGKKSGKERFEEYFSNIYQERWPKLKDAMRKHDRKIARRVYGELLENPKMPWPDNFEWIQEENKKEFSIKNEKYYLMDPASVICARALKIQPHHHVLDMCAAPGGKSLILSESLGHQGKLVCNEINKKRRERLKSVLRQYKSDQKDFDLTVTGKDGIILGYQNQNVFDRILLDAPCSSESHLLMDSKHLDKWSPTRTKKLSKMQYSLICSALLALKSEGVMLYSTCSISPKENDEVIKRVLEKKADQCKVLPIDQSLSNYGNITEYGIEFFPDHGLNIGPIYFSKLQKI